jgi:RNA polymerase sigma-70 factor (ECF subfamily)
VSSTEGEARLDPAAIGGLYVEHADALRAFLTGLLRNRDLASEALQATFGKAVARGHGVQPGSLRSWLFQVAYREAMAIRRRQGIEARSLQKLSWISRHHSDAPEEDVVRWESIRRVKAALERLPEEQRTVVNLRIYEEKTFAEIAASLDVPLGTVLTRMRLALQKLQQTLHEPE